MTSTVQTVSRQVVRRPWLDLDPKVVASALIALAADAVLVALYVTGKVDASVLAAGVGPTALSTVAAYAKASSHRDLVERGADVVAAVEAALPTIEAVTPVAFKPVLTGVEAVTEAFDAATRPSTAPLSLGREGGQ